MSADSLVFDMSSMAEGTPSVFVRKDWISILDNQNQNYQGNQCVIDTSQLANSNKYFNYREAYLTVPMLMTLTQNTGTGDGGLFSPATEATSADYLMGLKNWYGSIVHSLTVDYNGTTIVQQTPYCGLWNTFKLMTSLSYEDCLVNGASMGFWPDDGTSFQLSNADGTFAPENVMANNRNAGAPVNVFGEHNQFNAFNEGLTRRQQGWNFDPDALVGGGNVKYDTLISKSNLNLLWKSHIFRKANSVAGAAGTDPITQSGLVQIAITGQVYLKHLHSFFERTPLLKGVFMKLTLNLNQTSTTFQMAAADVFDSCSVQSPLGGVNPVMIASAGPRIAGGATTVEQGTQGSAGLVVGGFTASIAVGKTCLNTNQTGLTIGPPTGNGAGGGGNLSQSPLGGSVLLNVPAYTFNPVFETSYLSSPIKKIVYSDIYQYQVVNQLTGGQTFNQLITNGIANIKSVLVLPYYSASANGQISPIQSPFDPAGAGPTSPLCLITQFNIQISGQNAIYNTERYAYEQFLNQLNGANAINGNLTDGLTSSLVDQKNFEMSYNYYYVNCGRMLPVEEAVPKSVNILGTNMNVKAIDLFVFIEYGVEVSVDILTGARV
jgi:hypothetical protein